MPGLIAAQAMTTGVAETTYPVMGAIKWQKSFYAQLATPLEVRDLANAMLLFVLVRFARDLRRLLPGDGAVRGLRELVGPAARLAGDDPGRDVVRHAHLRLQRPRQGPESFGLIFRLGLIPLFLFSGAFFPISNLGTFGEWVARCTPLWHGVNLTRMLCLDTVVWSTAAINLAVLVVVTVVGWWLAIRTLTREARPVSRSLAAAASRRSTPGCWSRATTSSTGGSGSCS